MLVSKKPLARSGGDIAVLRVWLVLVKMEKITKNSKWVLGDFIKT